MGERADGRGLAVRHYTQKRSYRNSSPLVARVARDLYFVGKLKQRDIGRMFGLRQHSVSRMVSGQTWGAPR